MLRKTGEQFQLILIRWRMVLMAPPGRAIEGARCDFNLAMGTAEPEVVAEQALPRGLVLGLVASSHCRIARARRFPRDRYRMLDCTRAAS